MTVRKYLSTTALAVFMGVGPSSAGDLTLPSEAIMAEAMLACNKVLMHSTKDDLDAAINSPECVAFDAMKTTRRFFEQGAEYAHWMELALDYGIALSIETFDKLVEEPRTSTCGSGVDNLSVCGSGVGGLLPETEVTVFSLYLFTDTDPNGRCGGAQDAEDWLNCLAGRQ